MLTTAQCWLYTSGGFRKWWYPQIINFDRVFHYKPSILGYHYFWKHLSTVVVYLWESQVSCRKVKSVDFLSLRPCPAIPFGLIPKSMDFLYLHERWTMATWTRGNGLVHIPYNMEHLGSFLNWLGVEPTELKNIIQLGWFPLVGVKIILKPPPRNHTWYTYRSSITQKKHRGVGCQLRQ